MTSDKIEAMKLFISACNSLLKSSVVPRTWYTADMSFRTFPSVFVHNSPFFFFPWFISLLSHTLYIFFSLQLLNRKDKTTFEKLDYLMSKEDNYKRTREYIRSLKMVPSIPYLGRSLNWLIIY